MEEKLLINQVLGFIPQNYDSRSNIYMALRTARENEQYRPFVSLLLYLISFEQIGDLFIEDSEDKDADNNGIIKVFRYFRPELTPEQLQGIKHLRHSLAHNYGLELRNNYKYTINIVETNSNIITIPNANNDTYVLYFRSFIKVVEAILVKLQELSCKEELKFIGKNVNLNEIKRKYFSPSYAMKKQQFDSIEKLYHYTTFSNALKILTTNKLKFSELKNMNDINESTKNITRYITLDNDYNKTQAMITALTDELKKYKQLSFSMDKMKFKGYEIPSMWGHYAEKGYGICLVLDKKKLIEPIGRKIISNPIKYVKKYNNTIQFDGENIQKYLKKNIKNLFFKKTSDWAEEQEFRIISSSENYIDITDSLLAVILCLEEKTSNDFSINREIIKRIVPSNVLILHYNHIENELCSENGNAWNLGNFDLDI